MNAQELFLSGGKSAGVWFCGECNRVSANNYLAEECCKPSVCKECGEQAEQYRTLCSKCVEIKQHQVEAERFAKAEKVESADGMVYFGDTFYDSVYDIEDSLFPEPMPDYVWATKKQHFVRLRADSIIESVLDDAYEDFDLDDLHGLEELSVAIERFNSDNVMHVSFVPDYTKAILIRSDKND